MGIRFRCPNGHKLNVKDFLAGKRGICPDCGIKLQIPARSDPDLSDGKQTRSTSPHTANVGAAKIGAAKPSPLKTVPSDERHANQEKLTAELGGTGRTRSSAPAGNVVARTSPAAVIAANLAAAEQVGQGSAATPSRPSHGSPDLPRMVAPTDSSFTSQATPPAPAPQSAAVKVASPLWFVRPPSGGQFGPATDDIFRSWVTERRVTGDSYVWCEGWDDWRLASEAIPGLPPLQPSMIAAPTVDDTVVPAIDTATIVAGPINTAIKTGLPRMRTADGVDMTPPTIVETSNLTDTTRPELYRKRKSTKMVTMMIVVLTLACVTLFAALIYVVQ